MATLAELSQDLKSRLESIPELANAVSLSVVDDPRSTQYKNIPIPFAGVRVMTESNTDNDNNSRRVMVVTEFAVSLHVPNGSDDIINDVTYPLLEKVRNTIQGTSPINTALKWQFRRAQTLYVSEDRIHYIHFYTASTLK